MTHLNLAGIAADIAVKLASAGFGSGREASIRQVLCLAEEVGEFVGAYRRSQGMARRHGDWCDVEDELADVIITAFVTAEVLDIDLYAAIERKLGTIYSRGWRESDLEPKAG